MAGERARPSRHGQILGEALTELMMAGREADPSLGAEICATCAFRQGTMANEMAETGIHALNTSIGVDTDEFGCHHGMIDGRPTKLCRGYLAAKQAPWPQVQAIMAKLMTRIEAMDGPDEVRAAFDRWRVEVDPDYLLDDYQLARLRLMSPLTDAPRGEG